MASKYFIVFGNDDKSDIVFQVIGDVKKFPEKLVKFKAEVEKTLRIIRSIIPKKDETYNRYFDSLVALAQTGLTGENPRTEIGYQSLTSLQENIMSEQGGRIKGNYLKSLGIRAFIVGVTLLIIGFILPLLLGKETINIVSGFCYLLSGAMAGVWISTYAGEKNIVFDELRNLFEFHNRPTTRLIYVGLLTIVAGLLFFKEFLVIKIGTVSSVDFHKDIINGLIFGVVCGFLERTLESVIREKFKGVVRSKSK